MAVVGSSTSDRGQLLVITALSLAVLLVLTALALNTAVFGEVHVAETDDSVREEQGAIQFQDSVRRGVEGLIPVVNGRAGGYDDLEDDLRGEIAAWRGLTERGHARDGVAANATLNESHFETDIVQNESRNFTNQSGATDWVLVENTATFETYTMNISQRNLVNTSDCASGNECFNLSVNDGEWRLSAHETGDKVVVRVDTDSGNDAKCEATSGFPILVNVTNGSFDHAECGNTTFTPIQEDPGLTSPYTLEYTNADNVNGTYEFHVDGTVDEDNYNGPESGDSPRIRPAIVAADVEVVYRSADLTYRTEIRVTRGERDA